MKKVLSVILVFLAVTASCQGTRWEEFSSAEGAFTVLMPGDPEAQVDTVNTAAGRLDLHSFMVEQGDRVYGVSYADYPEVAVEGSDPETMLDGARDGAVANVQGTLLSELIISLEGHPGREIKVEVAGGEYTLQARIFLVDSRLYQILVGTPIDDAFSTDVDRFLDSFALQ